jgi:hypothetical protein
MFLGQSDLSFDFRREKAVWIGNFNVSLEVETRGVTVVQKICWNLLKQLNALRR